MSFMPDVAQTADSRAQTVATIQAASRWLIEQFHPEGYWVGMVDTNSAIEAEWLLASHILGVKLPNEEGVIKELLRRQRPDGSWQIYPGAPDGDVNSTVEVYAALIAKGFSADAPELSRAREWILAHGGLTHVRVFTRYWMALIGVWPWEATPNLPPEIIRLPTWFPFSIYNFAQWARATMVPLAVLSARRPVWPLPGDNKLSELFVGGREGFDFYAPPKAPKTFSVEWVFQKIDRLLHLAQTHRMIPGRERSVILSLEWIIRHQDADGAWGGIQPPWIYGLMALRNEGYPLTHPVIDKGLSALSAHWSFERDGCTSIQATESPVWDTLLSLLAMIETGHRLEDSPEMQKALVWALDRQVLEPGDWAVKVKGVKPGGWAFERANIFYPDVDDTAIALLVLGKLRDRSGALRPRVEQAIKRGVDWVFGMQSTNGGWGAFDKDNDKSIICAIPFCNFGEALDPPSVDVTAHVIEALAAVGYSKDHPNVARGLAFIRAEQEKDGCWFGRWGVNYIYGTGSVLPALQAIGEDMSQPYCKKAADWLLQRQNADGGWGESCASYMQAAARGRGPSTPAQTAWAVMSLQCVDDAAAKKAAAEGLAHLARTQRPDGTWDEDFYTATGFPGYGVGMRVDLESSDLTERLQQGPELSRGFMLSFNMYRHYFPMIALGRALHTAGEAAE